MDELRVILNIISQGGMSVIIFVIWYFTFNRSNKERDAIIQKIYEQNALLIEVLKDEQEYKLHLASILTRLDIKSNNIAQCPLLKEK